MLLKLEQPRNKRRNKILKLWTFLESNRNYQNGSVSVSTKIVTLNVGIKC